MTKLNKKLNGIVITALSAVAVACLFVPMWGYPDYGSEYTYSVVSTLKSYIDTLGFGSIFGTNPPLLEMTIMTIFAVATLVLAILTVVMNSKLFGHIAAGLSLVDVILLLIVKGGFVPTLYGTWFLLAAFALTAVWWLVTEMAPAQCKEMCRKFIIFLKRKPQMIPLAAFLVAFIVYSFNLTKISNTTALLQGSNMGLAVFAVMLFSMLSLLCCLNAFPYRKKVNIPMLVIMLVMIAIIVFCDVFYLRSIASILSSDAGAAIDVNKNDFIIYADWYIRQHIIILAVGVVLTALLPIYSKLLRKINTNIDVEGNGEMAAIDISAE